MRPLLTLSARWTALITAVALLVGIGAAFVRLLPWLLAPGLPISVAALFLQQLLRAALEVALLVGLPVGASTAAALFVESGASRALLALGASPARLVRSVAATGLAFVLLGGALGFALSSAESPTKLAGRLVEAGRSTCALASHPPRVDVPFIGAAWLCFPGSPRFVGRVHGAQADVMFSALRVEMDRSSGVVLRDLHVASRMFEQAGIVRVSAASARVWGLGYAGESRTRLAGLARGAAVAGVAAVVGLALAWVVVRRSLARPIASACVAAAFSVGALLLLREIDRHAAGALPEVPRSDR